ncbi:hypothetical protein D3C81_1160600 [compost metagenome]
MIVCVGATRLLLIVDLVGSIACSVFRFVLADGVIVGIVVGVIGVKIHPVRKKPVEIVESSIETCCDALSCTSSRVASWRKTIGLIDVIGIDIYGILALWVHFGDLRIDGILLIRTGSATDFTKIRFSFIRFGDNIDHFQPFAIIKSTEFRLFGFVINKLHFGNDIRR